MRFLFWNLAKNCLRESVTHIVAAHDIDVVVLAEAGDSRSEMLVALNGGSVPEFYAVDAPGCEAISMFTRFDSSLVSVRYETPRITFQQFCLPGSDDFLLVAAHMPSKIYSDSADQAGHCEDLAAEIQKIEDHLEHTRTVVIGDLNQNPFEEGMVSAKGLNAVMSKVIAKRDSRQFHGTKYRLFYNPMWGRLGDTTEGPPGTYFNPSSKKCEIFWHTLDQVLVRPSMLSRFRSDRLRILTSDGHRSLLNRYEHPSKSTASDHLPLVFELTI